MKQMPLKFDSIKAVNRFERLIPSTLVEEERVSVVSLALSVIEESASHGDTMSDPNKASDFIRLKLTEYQREVFAILFLDNQHQLIQYEEMFFGTIDGCSVHSREVVKRSLELNAAAVIFGHNHPSGMAEPSQADEKITKRLIEALRLVDIRVLDHIVVGKTTSVSFAQRGMI